MFESWEFFGHVPASPSISQHQAPDKRLLNAFLNSLPGKELRKFVTPPSPGTTLRPNNSCFDAKMIGGGQGMSRKECQRCACHWVGVIWKCCCFFALRFFCKSCKWFAFAEPSIEASADWAGCLRLVPSHYRSFTSGARTIWTQAVAGKRTE